MQNSLWGKGLVIGIIVSFFGTCAIPTLGIHNYNKIISTEYNDKNVERTGNK